MRIVKLLLVVGVMLIMTSSAFASVSCTASCDNSTLSVSCSGDTCQAGNGQVQCTTTSSCGTNCTIVTTQTVTCGAAPSGPGKTKNPEP